MNTENIGTFVTRKTGFKITDQFSSRRAVDFSDNESWRLMRVMDE